MERQMELNMVYYLNTTLYSYCMEAIVPSFKLKCLSLLVFVLENATSRYKTQDISLLLWLAYLYGVYCFGFPYLWIGIGNFAMVWILQYGVKANRPIDVDHCFRVFGTDPDTYGFPSIESYMSVVLLLPFVIAPNTSMGVQVMIFSYIFIVGLTRVYAAVRFPSQIMASWVFGSIGVLLGHQISKQRGNTPAYIHHGVLMLLIVTIVAVLANWIENNQSRIMGVSKSEYERVLSNIMQSDGNVGPQNKLVDDDIYTAKLQNKGRKKDSFYHLMHNMQQRSR